MALQRSEEFIKAFLLGKRTVKSSYRVVGFELSDALALLRLDDLFIESFEIKDGTKNIVRK